MSFSMLLGRVILPAAGLMLAAGIAWNSLRTIATRSETGSVDGSSAASQPNGRITAEGRVVAYPGAEVTVSTEVLGTIISMPAREKVLVKKGDLLVELRADDVRASLREAHHRLSEAEVAFRLEQTRARLDRIIPALTGRDRQPPDARTETLAAAQARRDADKAAVDRIDAESAKYRILAPIDGTVVRAVCRPRRDRERGLAARQDRGLDASASRGRGRRVRHRGSRRGGKGNAHGRGLFRAPLTRRGRRNRRCRGPTPISSRRPGAAC